jgi:hypothetical protein
MLTLAGLCDSMHPIPDATPHDTRAASGALAACRSSLCGATSHRLASAQLLPRARAHNCAAPLGKARHTTGVAHARHAHARNAHAPHDERLLSWPPRPPQKRLLKQACWPARACSAVPRSAARVVWHTHSTDAPHHTHTHTPRSSLAARHATATLVRQRGVPDSHRTSSHVGARQQRPPRRALAAADARAARASRPPVPRRAPPRRAPPLK